MIAKFVDKPDSMSFKFMISLADLTCLLLEVLSV